ncbi:MAG: hypothetical protein B6D44_07000 [Ignavibacteriales bacterium UTCHB2]|jgi:hypothetical protein|nr:MAG: hypothetical protein B6D44_07000 [Ignavibacteriales bacterium UTCHB2]
MDSNETIIPAEETNDIGELSHSDKMIGVFTEPAKTFSLTSKFPPRNKDWVIPVLILFFIAALIRIIAMTNEEVYFEAKKQSIDRIEKLVESGTFTREQGDEAINAIDQQMAFMNGPVGWVITIATSIIFGILIFIIIVGIYYLFIKFLLKGEGTFKSALVVNGLTLYISVLQMIVAGILTMLLGKMIMDSSLASILGSDKMTMTGWLFAKVDPISIWSYIVLSIGLAKMFKSQSTGKYYILVFGVWLIGMFILFQLAQSLPFLQNFIQ